MEIKNPEYLLLLFLLIPLFLLFLFSHKNGKGALKELGGGWRYSSLVNVFIIKNFFIFIFFSLSLFFATLAMADIRWDDQLIDDERDGYEIILCVDISRSMLADDIRPTRIAQTANKINWLVESMENSKFGIVIFKGKAVRVLPVTDDDYALNLLLATLSPDMITVPGSNLEEGIKVAMNSFHQIGKYRAILLFTDGENKSGDPLEAAKAAGEKNIPIIPIIVGTEAGGNIYLGRGNYLRNKEDIVLSKADRLLLGKIAEASGGKVFELKEFQKVKQEMLSITKQIENENIDKGLMLVKKEKYTLFLGLGLLFLIITLLIRGIRWKKVI